MCVISTTKWHLWPLEYKSMDKRLTQIWDPHQLVVELAFQAYLRSSVAAVLKDLLRHMPRKHLQK